MFLGGGDIDISIFNVNIVDNTIETINGFGKTIDSFRLSPKIKKTFTLKCANM